MLGMLACSCAHVLCVFMCLRAWHAHMFACFSAWRVYVLTCLACLRAWRTYMCTCMLVMMKCSIFLHVCVLGVLFCRICFTFQHLNLKILTAKKLCALLSWTYFLFTFQYQLKQYQFFNLATIFIQMAAKIK